MIRDYDFINPKYFASSDRRKRKGLIGNDRDACSDAKNASSAIKRRLKMPTMQDFSIFRSSRVLSLVGLAGLAEILLFLSVKLSARLFTLLWSFNWT